MSQEQSSEVKQISGETLAEEGSKSMPSPSESAMSADQKAQEDAKKDARDHDGRPFDPELHEVHADGSPLISPKGYLRKKRGRKSPQSSQGGKSQLGGVSQSQQGPGSGTGPAGGAGPGDQPHDAADASRQAAETTVDGVITLGMLVGGEEWQPRADPKTGTDERTTMIYAWQAYYKQKGVKEIPPSVLVLISTGGYIGARVLNQSAYPKTATRFQRFKQWTAEKIYRFQQWRQSKQGKPQEEEPEGAHRDIGDDRAGQNPAR